MTKETYRYQYEQWHQDSEESRDVDVRLSSDFIDTHGFWPQNKDAGIFDVGCGMGRLLLAFREKGYENLGGVDVDDYQIGIARKEKLDVALMGAGQFFSENKKSFDLITMIDCLEHIDKDQQINLLTEMNKSLTNDGALVIRVPNALAPAFGYFRYIDFTHKLSYTETSLTYVLKNAGFSHIVFRPAWRETENVIRHKVYYADLLKAEFGMENPILTENIVAIAFKSQEALDDYQRIAPMIEVKYENKKRWWHSITGR